eukprot:2819473-Pyramimonas_sp.AAC.1
MEVWRTSCSGSWRGRIRGGRPQSILVQTVCCRARWFQNGWRQNGALNPLYDPRFDCSLPTVA